MHKTFRLSALNSAISAMGKQRWVKERQYLGKVRQRDAFFWACQAFGSCQNKSDTALIV
jgi:hypothetical protein